MVLSFNQVADKALNGERLSVEDALFLYKYPNLVEIGRIADEVNRKKNSDIVFYNVNRHINPTNICAMSCKFCAYSRKPGEEGAYAYEIPEILQKAEEVVKQGATEVHMVGGLHPRWNFSKYTDIISALKNKFPDLHIKAFTAVELDWMARRDRRSVREILQDLKQAGLGSLPGGGAEIFHPEIREKICDTKTTGERWIEIHRTAHEMGLKSNCTMLYGHIENYFHRVDHMARLRDLQDITQGFNAFIPLSFQPHDNQMGKDRYTFGCDDLRTIAIARLFLDNFKNIKSYWIMFGQDIAQLALAFGANDLDGTVTEEKISRMAGGRAGIVMSRSEIESLIRKSQRIPQERDTLYQPIGNIAPSKYLFDNEVMKKTSMILYRVEQGNVLDSDDDALLLAKVAELDELAHCAARNHQTTNSDSKPSVTKVQFLHRHSIDAWSDFESPIFLDQQDMILELDEARITKSNLNNVVGVLKRIVDQNPRMKIAVQTLKYIFDLTKGDPISLEELFLNFKNSGINTWYESPHRTKYGITFNEVLRLHQIAHQMGLNTLVRIEIPAAIDGKSEVFWDSFINNLRQFQNFIRESNSIAYLIGVAIEPAPGVHISAHEYLRALSLARILLPDCKNIISNIGDIPTQKPALKPGSPTKEQPVLKLLPLVGFFGADVLGLVDQESFDQEFISDELRNSNILPEFVGIDLQPYPEGIAPIPNSNLTKELSFATAMGTV